jgi:dihydroorotate dehydrogenase electron transfer subunit
MQNSKITIQDSEIILNKKIKDNYYELSLKAPGIAKEAGPGQFVNIKVSDGSWPLLRRPFSIHRTKGSHIEILYKVIGRGTQILSYKRAGECLNIIGPLGNGFNYQLPIASYQLSILVAGGMGVAPLVFLAEKLKEFKIQNSKFKILALLGAKTKNEILCEEEFKELGCQLKIATDDGSRGFKGKVTELLKKVLPLAISDKLSAIYACGPKPMLKEIAQISRKYKIPAQGSLEARMACGFGACRGCVIKTRENYKTVCQDGPVFDLEEIAWRPFC